MKIIFPELSLVLLVGPSASGKSTFAKKHFKSTEIVSSDICRGMISDSVNNQEASSDAFDLLHFIVGKRLERALLTVVDATNLQASARQSLLDLARRFHAFTVCIAFDLDEKICLNRNRARLDDSLPDSVIRSQVSQMKQALKNIARSKMRYDFRLKNEEEVNSVIIERQALWSHLKSEFGPFDIIGDIHGCRTELNELLLKLGYQPESENLFSHPHNRKLIFLGDLVDRGPATPSVLRLVMAMVKAGRAICVPGNHDVKLAKKLRGKNVKLNHGLPESLTQLAEESEEFRDEVADFIENLVSHHVLDGGRLVVAHAGLKESMQGRGSAAVRAFALFGETIGEIDEFGLPKRLDWAAEYRGSACVVYGHTPVPNPEWLNNTVNIDTGCVFGGRLTAMRYPEREFESVPAKEIYCVPVRPLSPQAIDTGSSGPKESDGILDFQDFSGKLLIKTKSRSNVYIQEAQTATALDHLSRFAIDPRWLIYLPPTMAPAQASSLEQYLEHPSEAFLYYKRRNVKELICEEKHMGSRVILVVCRDSSVVLKRFGIEGDSLGVCYTRTGRRFFKDKELERQCLSRVQKALTESGFWERLETDWVCLDAEMMPWSLKAESLIVEQYAAVGAVASESLVASLGAIDQALKLGMDMSAERSRVSHRLELAKKYQKAYEHYCWPVQGIDDVRIAPFHIIATEGRSHFSSSHSWHLNAIAEICRADPRLLIQTNHLKISLDSPSELAEAIQWWTNLTEKGGEGMVIKPVDFLPEQTRIKVQPAIKIRGPEYLRIIYGPEYTLEENLERLRNRSVEMKHHLALNEFALGVEAVNRFVAREPLRAVHECIVGIMGLESEAIDPRL